MEKRWSVCPASTTTERGCVSSQQLQHHQSRKESEHTEMLRNRKVLDGVVGVCVCMCVCVCVCVYCVVVYGGITVSLCILYCIVIQGTFSFVIFQKTSTPKERACLSL